jgi:hypothetical protein
MYVSLDVKRIDLVTDGRLDSSSKACDLFYGGAEFETCLGSKLTFAL